MLSTQTAPSAAASLDGIGQPHVLADRQRERALGRLDVQRAAAGRERPLLVEDPVVRQLALVVARQDRAVRDHERRVAHAVDVEPRAPHHERHLDLAREHFRLRLACAQERGPQQEILGRVARDRELGSQHEIRAFPCGVGTGIGDALPVLGERSDREVELGQREAEHRFHRSSGLLRQSPPLADRFRFRRAPCRARRRASAASRRSPAPSASSWWATRRARGTRRAAWRTGNACAPA